MTSVVSPVPALSGALSNGLSNIAALGRTEAAATARLEANSRLADADIDRSTRSAQVSYAVEIGSYQRLSSIVTQGRDLTLAAATALVGVRTELGRASNVIDEFNSELRGDLDFSFANSDFQRILADVEALATAATFNNSTILTRTSSASIVFPGGPPAPLAESPLNPNVINVTARNFDNRPVADGGDGLFNVQITAAAVGANVEFTATATSPANGVATFSGVIDGGDLTAGVLNTGRTLVLEQTGAAATLSSLTSNRSQIVLSLDAGFDTALAIGTPTDFSITENVRGGAVIVEGRAAPNVDGAQDFQVQVAGSILEALGLSGASLEDPAKFQAATEAVAQAFNYLDLAIADVGGSAAVLENAARAVSAAIDNLEDGLESLGDYNAALELATVISTDLAGEYAERATTIASINSNLAASLVETAEASIEYDILEGRFPMEFVNFLNDEGTLGLISQLSLPPQDFLNELQRGSGALAQLGVNLPADIVQANAGDLIDSRQAIRDLASSIAAIGRPNVPNYVSRLD